MTSAEGILSAADRDTKADQLIRNCSLVSIVPGILPLPLIDLVALGGVQVYLVRALCGIYEIPFKKQRVKGILGAVIGGVAPAVVAPAAMSIVKSVPFIGALAGALTMPALTAASTLAVGRIFRNHFRAGGTLDDVDVDTMTAEYAEEVEKAKAETASKSRGKKTASATA